MIWKVRCIQFNRWLKNAPGTEWFITSPEEIKNLYNLLFKKSVEGDDK